MSRNSATAVGGLAIMMWALLALLTAASGTVPPFQLSTMAFAIGAIIGLTWIGANGRWTDLRQPLPVWLLGIGGLFGYHALYFTALRNAPPVEAGLIAYLWPLLIVVFSALLPSERLRWFHVLGALMGLSGTALLITGGRGFTIEPAYSAGYLAALACALTWSIYSIASRRYAGVPTTIVAGFCLSASLLSAVCHLLFETTVWPSHAGQWLAVIGLGVMPVGAAFYVWDIGVKKGDIQVLGALSYAAPLLSTFVLIAFGFGALTITVAGAALMITAGALVASKEMLLSARK